MNQLDRQAYYSFFSGVGKQVSINLYVKTGELFLKSLPERLGNLKGALAQYDNQSAIILAHQLKGALLSLGGNQLAETFKYLELNINLVPNEELIQRLDAKAEDLELFKTELRGWMLELETTKSF